MLAARSVIGDDGGIGDGDDGDDGDDDGDEHQDAALGKYFHVHVVKFASNFWNQLDWLEIYPSLFQMIHSSF